MKTMFRFLTPVTMLLSLFTALYSQDVPNDLLKLAKFEGKWEGNAIYKNEGKEYKFMYYTDFQKTAGGSGMLMHEWAEVPDLGKFDGENLIGYDPFEKKLHWYSVDNLGTTHEHFCQWKSENEFYMEHNSIRDGKKYIEKITCIFKDPKTMQFSLKGSYDNVPAESIEATFIRKM